MPGKALLKVLDKTILEYVIERVKKAKTIKEIIIATTTKEEDLQIADLAKRLDVDLFRGSEDDLLDRYYQAAQLFKIKHVVRICADCPLIDPDVIDAAVAHYFESGADYSSNTVERSFPDGLDVEVFSFDALKCAWEEAKLLSEREHVTPYIWKNPDRFKVVGLKNEKDYSAKRWTLDEKEDFELIRTILESLYPANPDFRMKDILQFLQAHPKLEDINSHIIVNEGYLKSLKEDKKVEERGRV